MSSSRLSITPVSVAGAPSILRRPGVNDDKYSRGVLGMVTGSSQYSGAALLGVTAALSTGVGMVRYVGPADVSTLVIESRPEVVLGPGRVSALVVGSGFPDVSEEDVVERVGDLLDESVPVVLDASAMAHRRLFPGPAILTPHQKELERLATTFGAPAGSPEDTAWWLAKHVDAVIMLKGHDTLVVSPDGRASRLPPGPTWLATAGTGDVLAGIAGAVVTAVNSELDGRALSSDQMHDAAVLAGLIHQEAATLASRVGEGEAPLLPSELALCVREAVAGFIGR